jgi:hypothetical protein
MQQTAPKPFVFVLMPFAKEYDDVYGLAIQAACTEAGAYAERVDQQIFADSILDRMFNQIAKADLIVADMSERNPNVFYEVGYAHALGKTTILLTRDEADIPFDLKHYQHIVYGGSLSCLKADLLRRVRWHLENPSRTAASAPDILVRVNDIDIVDGPRVSAPMRGAESSIRIGITLKNNSARVIRPLDFRLAMMVPDCIVSVSSDGSASIYGISDEQQRVFSLPKVISLLPEELAAERLRLGTQSPLAVANGDPLACCIRIYLESGTVDYPFMLAVE